jgi:S1-C subfamily serine protease
MFRYNIQKDLAILKFATSSNRSITYLPFVTKVSSTNTYLSPIEINTAKRIDSLVTMSDIYTIGYPKSLSLTMNFDYNRPLVRKGIIAGMDLQKGKIIADCPVYQGNSGGLVFESNLFDEKIHLVGVVSQFVPFEEHWINQAYGYYNTNIYNSGYTVIIPVDDIHNLLQQIKN